MGCKFYSETLNLLVLQYNMISFNLDDSKVKFHYGLKHECAISEHESKTSKKSVPFEIFGI